VGDHADRDTLIVADSADPVGRPTRGLRGDVVLGVGAPLAVVALPYALWWISDRLLYVGPLDRAAFAWAVVVPAWVISPAVAGFAWGRLSLPSATVAAAVVGATVGGAAAVLFWAAVAYPDCALPIRTAGDWVPPSVLLGGVIGVGVGASGLSAARLVRNGQPWRAIAVGAGMEALMSLVAVLAAAVLLLGPGCQRPPV
jgi:hypothetical protein